MNTQQAMMLLDNLALWYVSAVRNSGKSYLCSKFLAQAKKDKTFNKIYMITPSFASNRAYFGKYVDEEDVYEPTKESINQVIQRVEKDRDEWEDYQAKLKIHKEFLKDLRENPHISDEHYYTTKIIWINQHINMTVQ
jgi:hypothetical protein